MAVTKILTRNTHLDQAIQYVLNEEKTEGRILLNIVCEIRVEKPALQRIRSYTLPRCLIKDGPWSVPLPVQASGQC